MQGQNVIKKTIIACNKTAQEYANAHLDINTIKELIDEFIKNLKGKNILDAGCGLGRDVKYFLEQGLNPIGIDLSQALIKIASENVPKAKLIEMDMRNLTFQNETFDGIWACASFLHLPKKDAKTALRQFFNVLKPKGLLSISVKAGLGERFVEKKEYNGFSKFYSFYSEEEITELISSQGFKIQTITIDNKNEDWINVFAIKT
jgi:ubiquinone/menaquinone biosynthesis C-methylase UbiE